MSSSYIYCSIYFLAYITFQKYVRLYDRYKHLKSSRKKFSEDFEIRATSRSSSLNEIDFFEICVIYCEIMFFIINFVYIHTTSEKSEVPVYYYSHNICKS